MGWNIIKIRLAYKGRREGRVGKARFGRVDSGVSSAGYLLN
jgi:hypothetical protein